MRKRWIATLFAVFLCFVLTGCSVGSVLSKLTGASGNWVDSDLIGSVKEGDQIREQDDFAAAVNGPWKLKQGDKYSGPFQGVIDTVMANKKKVVKDTSINGKTAECLRDYYELASNWELRDKIGIEPLKGYVKEIESIDSQEKLYEFFADPARNPLYLSPLTTELSCVRQTGIHKNSYAVFFTSPKVSLTDANGGNDAYFNLSNEEAFDRFERVKEQALFMLGQVGYSKDEATSLIEDCMSWEKKVVEADNHEAISDPDKVTYSRKKAFALTKKFPFEKIVNSWGFKDTKYFLINPGYAKKLDKLCSEGNLDNVKAFLIVNYCLTCSTWLDRATYDKVNDLSKSKLRVSQDYGQTKEQIEDELIFDQYIGGSPMVGAMNRVYVEKFFDDDQVGELQKITQDVIQGFKEIFSEEEWLSEEGKAACIEKLEAIKVHIAYQDFDTVDYGKLHFKTAEEGGNLLEAWFASKRFEMDHAAWLSDQKYDASYWDPLRQDISTTGTNAIYMAGTNGIYIFAGICEAPLYSPEMSYEEKLGTLFAVVGHEITHGFDQDGAQYDKNGLKNAWLPSSDQEAFNDKCDHVGTYYTTLSPYPNSGTYNGRNVSQEATADMGGLKVTLHLAEKEPDFDYDKYFRAYANMWKQNVSLETEKGNFQYDAHPLAFYRINVGLQQFDEFFKIYGIKKGDNMYVKEKDRIKVW